MDFEIKSDLHDRLLKSRRLHARIRISASATPANKVHQAELSSMVKLKSEGIDDVTGSDAAASTDMGAKVDASGTFGVCMLASGLGSIERVISAAVQPLHASATCAMTLVNTGTTAYGLSAAGNIAINGDSSLSFATDDLDAILSVDYLRRGN